MPPLEPHCHHTIPTCLQGHCLFSCLGQSVGLLPIPRNYEPESAESGIPLGCPPLPALPPSMLHAPPAPLISPSDSFLLSTLKTGISASKCQFQLGEAGTHQGLPPRQIYRAIKLSLAEAGRGSSSAGPAQPTWLCPVSRVHLEWIAWPGSEGGL